MIKIKEAIISVFLISILLILSGVEQCPTSGTGGNTQASKYGVDFNLQQGFGKLYDGATIPLESTFVVDILLENYDSSAKTGQICIADDISDAFEGISGKCKPFSIGPADYFKGAIQTPASVRIIFPDANEYKYSGIPIDTDATLYATISYIQHSVISGSVKTPVPETEPSLTLSQIASPVTVTAEKSVLGSGNDVKVNLNFGFTKQENYNTTITSTDFKKGAIAFSAVLGTINLDCPDAKSGIFEFKNTKFISCSALLPREQTTNPMLLTLDYGVKLSKEFAFKIKK